MIKPLSDRILVKKVNLEVKTKGGLFLGEIESERDVCYGQVVAVGPGKQLDNTGAIPMTVKEKDLITFNDSIARRINYKGEYLFVIRESDVYAIIEDKEISITSFVTEKMENKQPRVLG